MQLIGYLALLLGLVATVFAALYAAWALWSDREEQLATVEKGHLLVTFLVTFASMILLGALAARNYSFYYVYENVDNTLSMAYTLTAFWAGREGSMLFWALLITLAGGAYIFTPGYRSLRPRTKLYFWLFFLTVQAFFLLLVTSWSNPFVTATPTPPDGRGLNPLLRNPGMVFHPPLLFMGYAGFTLPACTALAAWISGEPRPWVKVCRNWNILAWIFLTAGIVLGGWWSYMELGWGGYWAWDPVENASLIPWFSATAFLHTALIESRRGALQRTNVFLMALTFLLCVFGTYLVRSGVIDSLHAFGGGGVGLPLMLFMLVGLGLSLVVLLLGESPAYRTLSGFTSRQGLLVITAWIMIALGLVVGMGTMWPVISKMWSASPVGLDARFYNRVCLPLLSLVVLVFCVCPWLAWKDGVRNRIGLLATGGVFLGALIVFYAMGVRIPLALITASLSVAALASIVLVFALLPGVARMRSSWGAYGVHCGVALLALGIAFSGPYKVEREMILHPDQPVQLQQYTLTLHDVKQDRDPEMSRVWAEIEVTKGGEDVGTLLPERRLYRNFPQPFAEVSVIPGLGDELYSTLLGYEEDGSATIKASINPLVNWVWIGGTLMCLLGFLLLRREKLGVV